MFMGGLKNMILTGLVILQLPLKSQHFAPIAVGKYSGVHAAKLNPALTAYTPYKWHVNIVGVWANVNNNYMSLQLPYSAYHLPFNTMPDEYKTVNGNARFDSSFLYEDLNRKRKFAGVGAMAYLPSARSTTSFSIKTPITIWTAVPSAPMRISPLVSIFLSVRICPGSKK
jgi:hypothetical protein